MGIQYGNITLQGVNQKNLVEYLSEIGREAFVSPTVNGFTTLYDKAIDGATPHDLLKLSEIDSKFDELLNDYDCVAIAVLACLASHLSGNFSCSAIAVYIYDGSFLWYHLCSNSKMIDEYITYGDDKWKPKSKIRYPLKNGQIRGGDAEKLCNAFGVKEVLDHVETVLRKPNGYIGESFQDSPVSKDLSRYDFLLNTISGYAPLVRHEAIARVLGICPGWVLGLNYLAINTGELIEHWEDFRFYEGETIPPSEEIEDLIRKTN